MLCISATITIMLCPSVHLSVTFADHVKTNKHIFDFFSPLGILVFPYQTGWRYSDRGNFARYRCTQPFYMHAEHQLHSSISLKDRAFLSRVSTLTRDIDIANMSVCPSVCYIPVSDENDLTYRHSFFHHTVA